MGARELSTLMDGLVAEARSSRDGAFNALDAVQRESRRNTQRLAGQVDRYLRVHETSMAEILRREVPRLLAEQDGTRPDPGETPGTGGPAARDARFDPEDEWEVSGPDTGESCSAARVATPARDDDDDDYPGTWLR